MNEYIQILQLILSWLLIVAVLLPMVHNDYWVFRVFEYPRYQKFVLCTVALISLFINRPLTQTFVIITVVILALCVLYLGYKIWPYTAFSSIEMTTVKPNQKKNQLKLFAANVYQENTAYHKLLDQVKVEDPDVIMLVETDKKWEQAVKELDKDYPHILKEPRDNTYGLLFYSRFKFVSAEVKYLVEDDVPSVEAVIELPSGEHIKIFGLHPKPPVPGEDDRSTAKDKELMKIAFKAKEEKLPVIVLGDLNDVAWSYVTGLFRKTSGLLDPRRGRGFFSTFSAFYWFMRFPLDYVFCSAHFGLINMKRLGKNGSDHFPMLSHFELMPVLEARQDKPHADSEELQQAAEKANQPA
ncbi:endonuclease/exonuclease/phosphatase family protein [Aridibaculum aurantiacum]|uniref:endonuclease/exonuclease/phosphatase family protein n=1 Tax=Aridibaculum aurantiacum TaxID=2810307 RepID=UPI001A96B0E3|nr:endonuclease/exonuclease/phosphatase family protein [Aridibaculum aurantiacum]